MISIYIHKYILPLCLHFCCHMFTSIFATPSRPNFRLKTIMFAKNRVHLSKRCPASKRPRAKYGGSLWNHHVCWLQHLDVFFRLKSSNLQLFERPCFCAEPLPCGFWRFWTPFGSSFVFQIGNYIIPG